MDRWVNVLLIICLVALVSKVLSRGLTSESEIGTAANGTGRKTGVRAHPVEVDPMLAAPIDPVTEDGRRALYLEIVRARERAERDAKTSFPGGAGHTSPLGAAVDKRSIKRLKRIRALEVKYLAVLAAHHGLSQEELRGIHEEGQAKNWASREPEWRSLVLREESTQR